MADSALKPASTVTPLPGGVTIETLVDGQGPCLALLPSRGRDALDCDAFVGHLARGGYRVLRPMPRGTGRSAGPLDGLTLRDLAADVAGALRAHSDGPAVLIGHAYGNWIARAVASFHPEQVRGVVLAAASAARSPAELSAHVDRSADDTLPAQARLASLRHAFFAPGNDAAPWLEGWHPAVARSQQAAAAATPRDIWWAAGTAPLLDLQAEHDPFRPPASRDELRRALGPRVSTRLVAGASHALLPERPGQAAMAIIEWLRTLPRAGDGQADAAANAGHGEPPAPARGDGSRD